MNWDVVAYFFLIVGGVCGLFLAMGIVVRLITHLPTLIREHARRNQR